MRLRGWTAKRTAERFVLHPNTVRNWQKSIRDKYRAERTVGEPPWNKLHEAVRWTVHEIRRLCPEREFGTRSIARYIVRAGIQISRASVRRILEEDMAKPCRRTGCVHRPITNSAPAHLKRPRHPHHVWHMDITEFRVLWLRVHVVAIMDGFSRKIVTMRAFKRSVTTKQIVVLLDHAAEPAGCMPRFMITDHGCQFRCRFRHALRARRVIHARSPVGTWQFNAKIERFFRSLKFWQRGTLLVPSVRLIQKRLDAYRVWHNAHRPHAALGLLTPNEAEWSRRFRSRAWFGREETLNRPSKSCDNPSGATLGCSTWASMWSSESDSQRDIRCLEGHNNLLARYSASHAPNKWSVRQSLVPALLDVVWSRWCCPCLLLSVFISILGHCDDCVLSDLVVPNDRMQNGIYSCRV